MCIQGSDERNGEKGSSRVRWKMPVMGEGDGLGGEPEAMPHGKGSSENLQVEV